MTIESGNERESSGPSTSSRRDLIKKGAIAGGVVWAAPVVQSLAAGPAGAATLPTLCTPIITPPSANSCVGTGLQRGGQFTLTFISATGGPTPGQPGQWDVTWPVATVCTGLGCTATTTWSWVAVDNGATVTSACQAGTTTTSINNNVTLVSGQATSTLRINTHCTGGWGRTIKATVTVTCNDVAGSSSTACRTERVRNGGPTFCASTSNDAVAYLPAAPNAC